jgi:hypothetical protein
MKRKNIDMTAYKGTFIKKDGQRRTMRFLKVKDLPKSLLEGKFTTGKKHNISEGSELVWDIDENDFRIFNHKMMVDNLEEFDYTLP